MNSEHNTLKPGDEISGYLITQKNELQQGPGTTYHCKHPYSQSQYQARIFPRKYAEDTAFIKKLTGTGQEMARFKHPCLLRIHLAGEDNGLPCLISESFDAPTLANRIASKAPLCGEYVHCLLLQLIEAVEYLHKNNTTHGSINPKHILTTDDGQLRLDGLGLAQLDNNTLSPEQDIHDFGNTITTLLPLLQTTAQWSLPTAPIEKWQAFADTCQQNNKDNPYHEHFQLQTALHKLGPKPSPISFKAAILVATIFATLATLFFLALDR